MDMLSLTKLNCIFFFLLFCSCSDNKTQINSKEIELTTVNDRNMTCVYVKGDEVLSDMCFAFFKVSKGTILRVEPVDYYPNAYTKNIRNKNKHGYVSNISINAICTILNNMRNKYPLDSIWGIEIFSTFVFDVEVKVSSLLDKKQNIEIKDINRCIALTTLKDDFNMASANLGIHCDTIIVDFDGKIGQHHVDDGKLYGYTSDLPKRLLAFPLFLQLKKQE